MTRTPTPLRFATAAALAAALVAVPALAAEKGDPEKGRKLLEENKCDRCHLQRFGGDGSGIYTRKDRKVTSARKLEAQVAACNSELGTGLFPEEEAHVAAYLNSRYYHFD